MDLLLNSLISELAWIERMPPAWWKAYKISNYGEFDEGSLWANN